MIMTEILDLDHARKVCQYGTLGLCQTWKQLRDFPVRFPIYETEMAKGEIFQDLGSVEYQSKLDFK